MLEQVAHFNDLSPALREKLEKKVASFGKSVMYSFNIARPDPHPDNRGKTIYPGLFTLGPVQFDIVDKEEDRKDKSKLKKIAIVKQVDDKGKPIAFDRIVVHEFQRGIIRYDLEKMEDVAHCMLMELHPKLEGGMFQDKNVLAVVSRVDELARAKSNRANRKTKAEAMYAAENFTDQQARDFVCGMNWDETEEMEVLRERIETLAEEQPGFFTDFVNSPTFTYKATVKRAFDRQIILYVPVENKVIWGSNQQAITILERVEGEAKNEVDRFAEYLIYAKNGEEIYKKLKALLK